MNFAAPKIRVAELELKIRPKFSGLLQKSTFEGRSASAVRGTISGDLAMVNLEGVLFSEKDTNVDNEVLLRFKEIPPLIHSTNFPILKQAGTNSKPFSLTTTGIQDGDKKLSKDKKPPQVIRPESSVHSLPHMLRPFFPSCRMQLMSDLVSQHWHERDEQILEAPDKGDTFRVQIYDVSSSVAAPGHAWRSNYLPQTGKQISQAGRVDVYKNVVRRRKARSSNKT